MGDSAPNTGANPKRHAVEEPDGSLASKRLLQQNQFAALPVGVADPPAPPATDHPKRRRNAAHQQQQQQQQQQRKERCPPIFVLGYPVSLKPDLVKLIGQGLKCTMRRCHDGVKLFTDGVAHYNKVVQYLQEKAIQFHSHDFPGTKPLKVVLHGLDHVSTDELKAELIELGLKPVNIYFISRRGESSKQPFRDQLYLVHLEKGSASMSDLKAIRVVNHTVVEWTRYRPKRRDVTQCTKCLRFGHGTRHCAINARCNRCGEAHTTNECNKLEEADPKCANCGQQHPATDKSCPKRAEYLNIRQRASTRHQHGRRTLPPAINERNFPAIPQPRHQIPVLPPLQPHKRLAAAAASIPAQPQAPLEPAANPWPSLPPPGFRQRSEPELPLPDESAPLYTPEQLVPIFEQLAKRLRSCRTRYDQIYTLGIFVIQNA